MATADSRRGIQSVIGMTAVGTPIAVNKSRLTGTTQPRNPPCFSFVAR
jgi:hypothetical protein